MRPRNKEGEKDGHKHRLPPGTLAYCLLEEATCLSVVIGVRFMARTFIIYHPLIG